MISDTADASADVRRMTHPTTWRLVIEYDGREYSGFQRQNGPRTVQQELEEALSRFFGGERIIVHGSGRTDAGVHALAQVVSFRAETQRDPRRVRLALNTFLSHDMACIEAAHAPFAFHARMSACGKTYRYAVLARPDRSAFHRGRAWYVRQPVDWAAVEAGLALLVGTHDFSAFRGSRCTMLRTTRPLWRAEHRVQDGLDLLEFDGPGFLRYQVRIMVGTVVDLGLGRRTLEQVRLALETGQRSHAGRTAPPDGLFLVRVHYPAAALLKGEPTIPESTLSEPAPSESEADEE